MLESICTTHYTDAMQLDLLIRLLRTGWLSACLSGRDANWEATICCMDSSLASFQDDSSQVLTVATETSRCARCVKDKKGCDRLLPCSRCIESGISDTCVYTGAIQRSRRRRSSLGRRRGTLTNTSDRSAAIQLDTALSSSAGAGLEDEDNASILTPGDRRRRKLRLSSGKTQNRGPLHTPTDEVSIAQAEWLDEELEAGEHFDAIEHEKSEEEIARTRIYNGFSDIVTHLPVEIYRSTTFVRALDLSYHDKCTELDTLCRELQHESSADRITALRSKICQLMQESSEDRSESIVEVAKLQTLVESHISILSAEIEAIESPQSMAPLALETSADTKTPVRKPRKVNGGRQAKDKDNKIDDVAEADDHDDGMDIPIDDDEPTYCYCERVSFGKMIACENEGCEGGEWFHFECLGWTAAPRGQWWCRVCTEAGFGSKKFARRTSELDGRSPEESASGRELDTTSFKRGGRGRGRGRGRGSRRGVGRPRH